MEKKRNETKKPFSDAGFRQAAGFLSKDQTDLSFKQHIRSYLKTTALDNEKIKVLLHCCQNKCLDQCLQELYEGGYLSREERDLFIAVETVGCSEIDRDDFIRNPEAYKTGFKAVSHLVRANPGAIGFPFVQTAMANLIRLYRDILIERETLDKRKREPLDKVIRETPKKLLEDLKEIWNSFLPSRQGGNLPYKKDDLQRLLDIGIKQGYTRTEAIDIISQKLNISFETLSSILKVKTTKGRPRKSNP
jgi:hypothetical protein